MLFSSLSGCGDATGNKNKRDSVEPEKTLINDFSIIAYSGPPQDETNLERYQEMAEAGFEYLVPSNGANGKVENIMAMDLAQQVGMKVIPIDTRYMPFRIKQEISMDSLAVETIVNDYKDHPALAAYVVRDEPSGKLFTDIKTMSDVFNKHDSEHPALVNALPSYGGLEWLAFDDYRSYVKAYIDILKPVLFSYDYYPLRIGHTEYDGWYSDLSIIREETRKAGIPFIAFIQSQGIKNGLRIPNRAEILWQANTLLAYGSRGIAWFSYWTPKPDHGFGEVNGEKFLDEQHVGAMIDIEGNRTELYDQVKEANMYLKIVGRGLIGWDNTDVARYEAGQLLEGTSPFVTPEGEEAHIVIGTYKKDNKARIVISNSSCENPVSFSLRIPAEWKSNSIFASIDAESIDNASTQWTMKAGGSVVIELHP